MINSKYGGIVFQPEFRHSNSFLLQENVSLSSCTRSFGVMPPFIPELKPVNSFIKPILNYAEGNYSIKVRSDIDPEFAYLKKDEFRVYAASTIWQKWYFFLFAAFVFIGLPVSVAIKYLLKRNRDISYQLKNERRFIEIHFKALRNQMAPHFVFNALNAIGSSIYQDDKEKSYDFLQRFATLIRSTLLHADESYLTLKEELEFVKNYLDLEKFRFENKFDYFIEIGDSINLEVNVPKMIIQTFVENAVKHGLVPKAGKGMLTVRIREEKDFLAITIDDDGIGRDEASKINAGSTGKGIEIMNEFITLSNSYNEQKISFEIHDIPGDMKSVAGTHVSIKLPVKFTYNSLIKTQ